MALDGILTNGVTEILNKLVLAVDQEITPAWGVKDELKKLQRTIEMILAVVADAERRQVTEQAVRLWLRWLKDVVYEADDVMDDFSYETSRREQRGDCLKHKVLDFISSSNPLAFRFKMAKKIKNINRRLDEITENMHKFHLQSSAPSDTTIAHGEQQSRHTTSFSSEPEIVGRKDDTNQIINLLTSSSSSITCAKNSEKVSVISLVGMGGLGKTTLAQLIYQDELIKKQFELKMWVHVSECFDVKNILTNIMESIIQTKFHSMSNSDVLENKVREQLHGKKYLLVLDDVWNEDLEQWEMLKSVLLVGGQGSKILITTRKDLVASTVGGSIPPYKLGQLSDDACWSLIQQKAFSPGGASNTPQMECIGKEIAKKCRGLPLAAKFLGGLLHSKNKESNWISIQNDDIWNAPEGQRKVLPVLKLSYNNLPSHLKQCFSYCSIFPKNSYINKENLIQLWMAEGFLKPSDVRNRESIENIGNEYFQNLVWSSFFHNLKKDDFGDIKTCQMHDLVHDLAKDALGKYEFESLKVSKFKDVSAVRRLQLELDEDISAISLKTLSNAKKLRALFIPTGSKLHPSVFSVNKHLRILHVGSYPGYYRDSYPKLPSLSFRLRHLRYLCLSFVDIREVKNDQSIRKLYSLETLILTEIHGVQILLTNIQALQKLRYLEVSFTDMVELPDSVTSLCNLQTLDLHCSQLKVIPDSISGLKNLRFLNLSFNQIEELPISVTTLSNLQTLDVSSCEHLKALPESVVGLASLRIFNFEDCPLLKELPEDFGALTQLRYLNLDGTGIMVLPESFANLSNIEYLNLFNCELPKDVNNLTKLRKFIYNWRSNPVVLGVGKLVCLQELVYLVPEKLTNDGGIEEIGNLKFLEVLDIWDLKNVKDPIDAERANLKGKQNLRELFLRWGEEELDSKSCNVQVFEALQPPSGLKRLTIHNFMGFDLPSWMCVPSCLPNLDTLELINCKEINKSSLMSLDVGGFSSLISLQLTDMFLLEELGHSNPCLRYLTINGCKSLTEIPSFPSLVYLDLKKVDYKCVSSVGRSQTSLVYLGLNNIEDLIYFPINILQNNPNLRDVSIRNCNQLEGFGIDDDENVVALEGSDEVYSGSIKSLDFVDCPVLKFLPDFRGWTSLQSLSIKGCPQVKDSLTYDLISISSLVELLVDFIQKDEQRGDPSNTDELINLMK